MTTQPNQSARAREVMRGHARDLLHNHRMENRALADANRAIRERRQKMPLMWRTRAQLREWWAGRGKR